MDVRQQVDTYSLNMDLHVHYDMLKKTQTSQLAMPPVATRTGSWEGGPGFGCGVPSSNPGVGASYKIYFLVKPSGLGS